MNDASSFQTGQHFTIIPFLICHSEANVSCVIRYRSKANANKPAPIVPVRPTPASCPVCCSLTVFSCLATHRVLPSKMKYSTNPRAERELRLGLLMPPVGIQASATHRPSPNRRRAQTSCSRRRPVFCPTSTRLTGFPPRETHKPVPLTLVRDAHLAL